MTIHARNSRRTKHPLLAPTPSPIEELFALQIRAANLPRPQRELRLHPTRKWRFDFAWLDMRLVVEIEGEVHRIRERFHADLEKYAWLTLEGFTLLRVGGREVRSGIGLTWLQRLVWERAPLGLSRAHESGETRDPAPARGAQESEPVSSRVTDLWITAANDAPGGVAPSLGGRKWVATT